MGEKGKLAEQLFREEGYNCAQAVAIAFCDKTGFSKEATAAATAGFGGGFGRRREVCGACSGMTFVLGCLFGGYDPKSNEAKMKMYHAVQTVLAAFEAKNGSIICRELLEGVSVTKGLVPEERNTPQYQKRPCFSLVADAADILEDYLSKQTLGE